jgi:hypothetical protein
MTDVITDCFTVAYTRFTDNEGGGGTYSEEIPCISGGLLYSREPLIKPDFIPYHPMSQASATRSLNTTFQISTTRDCSVTYSVGITCGASDAGSVYLETASDSEFTTGLQELARFAVSASTMSIPMSAFVPAGFYVRLRTSSDTGSPSFAYRSGQEVLTPWIEI